MNKLKKVLASDIIKRMENSNIPAEHLSTMLDLIEDCPSIENEVEQVHEFRKLIRVKTSDLLDAEQNLTSKELYFNLEDVLKKLVDVAEASGTFSIKTFTQLCKLHARRLERKYVLNHTYFKKGIIRKKNWKEVAFNFVDLQEAITNLKYDIGHFICATGLHEIDAKAFNVHHTNNMNLVTQDGFIDADILENQENAKGIRIHPFETGKKGSYVLKCEHDPSGNTPFGTIMEPPGYEKLEIWKLFKGKLSKLTKIVPILLLLVLMSCQSCDKTEVIEEAYQCGRHDCIAYNDTIYFNQEPTRIILNKVTWLERHLQAKRRHFISVVDAQMEYSRLLTDVYRIHNARIECTCND